MQGETILTGSRKPVPRSLVRLYIAAMLLGALRSAWIAPVL